MGKPVDMVEVWRGDLLESVHQGHAVVCDDLGQIVQCWGDPDKLIFPRSSCKMVQALPLVESGIALSDEQLALACASHSGAAIHIDRVGAWLRDLGLTDDDFRCGPQMPRDPAIKTALIKSDQTPCQIHNNCSGKHAGFLHLTQHIGAGPDYELIDHPIQQLCKSAFEETVQETSPLYGIDGCSAPNHACTLHGLARSMAFFASAHDRSDARSTAASRLVQAMAAHPALVAGEGRACTELMRAMQGKVTIKTGAEGVFTAIIPEKRLGVAVKAADGSTRAAECVIAAILVKLGVLDALHPAAIARMNPPIANRRGTVTGHIRPAAALR
ncbi:asparaginase [Yoonia sediminilitoris]|uniref:Asparaginase n=1 Tax=Yoonia sediminilitoris TaxID=1286148 RepID=A0A2T6KPH1_9RHOB|nr:asparaginase [Yoonia sediminilitoris]PUB18463.1 asparaginase [Yoonia sediminilitoris]RCW98631.1 asparaginase [Yoonia sediminilitoris]